jgi:signal peptidase I
MEPNPVRNALSTIVITSIGGFVGGFLWIGRPGLAILFFVLQTSIFLMMIATDASRIFANVAIDFLAWTTTLLAVLVVLLFRTRSFPLAWHSRWYAALPIGLIVTLVAAVLIRSMLYQLFSSPASSMAPTLVVGDQFLAAKSAYGYSRYSFPFGIMPIDGRISANDPKMGDIVVFVDPERQSRSFVKRVIGLPGDTVQMIGGVLHINGTSVEREELAPIDDPSITDSDGLARVFRETLPNGVTYTIIDLEENTAGDDTALFDVPDSHFFAMGDNRDNSNDSRFFLGYIPLDNLVGRAERIIAQSEGKEFWERRHLRSVAVNAVAK